MVRNSRLRRQLTEKYQRLLISKTQGWVDDRVSGQIVISMEFGDISNIKFNEHVGLSAMMSLQEGNDSLE